MKNCQFCGEEANDLLYIQKRRAFVCPRCKEQIEKLTSEGHSSLEAARILAKEIEEAGK